MVGNTSITIRPETRKKGYLAEELAGLPTADDRRIAERIDQRFAAADAERLSADDRALCERVRMSYRRHLDREAPHDEDFRLSGHEIAELALLPVEKTLRYVAYRYRYSKFPQLKMVGSHPPCLQVEVSSVCNFRCVMCYQTDPTFSRKSSGHMGHMSLPLFKRVIDGAEGRIEAITFASRGEPLLNPALPEMLDYCRGKFLGLKLNTNGSLLTERLVHALLSSDLQTLVISADAADPELYERVRVNGKFDKLVRNLEMLKRIRETDYPDSKTVVRVSGVKINDEQKLEDMTGMWSRFADAVSFTYYNPWQDAYGNPANEIAEPCTELWRRMFVWWNGVVNPCDFDYKSTLSAWTIEADGGPGVSEIWTSAQYQALREAHLSAKRGDVEPCRRCVVT